MEFNSEAPPFSVVAAVSDSDGDGDSEGGEWDAGGAGASHVLVDVCALHRRLCAAPVAWQDGCRT